MSFNNEARKVRDCSLTPWRRWSRLHSCLQMVLGFTPKTWTEQRREWMESGQITPSNPPTHEFLMTAINQMETERNLYLERLRTYERKRIREKMRGRRKPAAPLPGLRVVPQPDRQQ